MKQMALQHFVLTRFNVRLTSFLAHGAWKGGDEDYLRTRFALFERFCLPSMARQRADFRWLVLFSELTPEQYKERARALSAICPVLEPVFLPDREPLELPDATAAVSAEIESRLAAETTHVVTTRIDNDDAFNVEALSWIRSSAEEAVAAQVEQERILVVLPHGNVYLCEEGFTQSYTWAWNHFPTMVCRRGVQDHILSVQHARIGRLGLPVVRDVHRHAWLEIVNGTNLKNGFRPVCRPEYLGSKGLRQHFALDVKASRWAFLRFLLLRYLPARVGAFLRGRGKGVRG